MNNCTVYFASLPNGYFGNAPKSWLSLDVEILSKSIVDKGYIVKYISVIDILNIKFKKGDVIIYTAFFNNEVVGYLKDILFYLKDKCLLIPTYEMLLSYENKGFQEVLRKKKNIDNLDSSYLFDMENIKKDYPFVFKTIDGSGSAGVKLIKSESDFMKVKNTIHKLTVERKIKNIIRKNQLSPLDYKLYKSNYKNYKRFITQRFIENLTCDYRVLIVGQKFYVMRRDVRDGDFRASGSKKFNYNDAPLEVLNFAKEIQEKLDNVYISIDIALKEKNPYLIEYQGTNFGSSVLRNSEGYYRFLNDNWEYIKEKSYLEETFSVGYLDYLERKLVTD